MKTIIINAQNIKSVHKQATPCVIALGYFDGVHLGHQQVIKEAREEANVRGLPLALMSFRPHPINVLSGGKRVVPHITTLCQKQEILENIGVDLFYLVDFTTEFATLSSKQFVQDYLLNLGVVHAVAGFDFSYGAKGAAQLHHIPEEADGYITVTEVACIHYKNEKISSTAIRQRLLSAKVHEIHYFLGENYTVKANWNGHQFQQIEKTILPASGIYEVELDFLDNRVKANVLIDELGGLHLFSSIVKLIKGTVTIHWLKHVEMPVPSLVLS